MPSAPSSLFPALLTSSGDVLENVLKVIANPWLQHERYLVLHPHEPIYVEPMGRQKSVKHAVYQKQDWVCEICARFRRVSGLILRLWSLTLPKDWHTNQAFQDYPAWLIHLLLCLLMSPSPLVEHSSRCTELSGSESQIGSAGAESDSEAAIRIECTNFWPSQRSFPRYFRCAPLGG